MTYLIGVMIQLQATVISCEKMLKQLSRRGGQDEEVQEKKLFRPFEGLPVTVQSIEEFQNLEKCLTENAALKDKLIEALKALGGKTAKVALYGMDDAIMLPQVAENITWEGVNGKSALMDSPVKGVVFDAFYLLKVLPPTTFEDFKSVTNAWLKSRKNKGKKKNE